MKVNIAIVNMLIMYMRDVMNVKMDIILQNVYHVQQIVQHVHQKKFV